MLIGAASEVKEEAWEFVQFFNNEENQKTWALEMGDLPTRKALYDDRVVREALPMIAQAREALLNVRPRPVSGHYSEMSRAMALQFNNVLRRLMHNFSDQEIGQMAQRTTKFAV